MNPIVVNILLILLFILIGGVFAAAEMSLVSLRASQVHALRLRGKRGRTVANLTADPNRFLSAVQIGVTLSGFLSAAFGGALLSDEFAAVLIGWGMSASVAPILALVLITIAISYFSIVLGELAAKRLAMQRAESFAIGLAPLVNVVAMGAKPIIWFLGKSTDVVVRLLGGDPNTARKEVTDEELRQMVGSSTTLGKEERHILDEVFTASDIRLREAMIPRTEVDFLDGSLTIAAALSEVLTGLHSRYPVIGRDTDHVLGFVHVRDLAAAELNRHGEPVTSIVRPILMLPQSMRILRALSDMRETKAHLAIVQDEYGGTAGIVTIEDLIEELIGDITDEFDAEAPEAAHLGVAVEKDWVTTEVDGLITIEDATDEIGYELPEGPYDTVAGFVMAQLGTLPGIGDTCEVTLAAEGDQPDGHFSFEVIEVDGHRVARVRVTRLP